MACGTGDGGELPTPLAAGSATPAYRIEVTSPAFTAGETIPVKHTRDGDDVAPALSWSLVRLGPAAAGAQAPPAEVRSFALIAEDPDAPRGTWTHWVVYGIPQGVAELHEEVPTGDRRESCRRRQAGSQRLQAVGLRRALSSGRRTAPVHLQGLRAGR